MSSSAAIVSEMPIEDMFPLAANPALPPVGESAETDTVVDRTSPVETKSEDGDVPIKLESPATPSPETPPPVLEVKPKVATSLPKSGPRALTLRLPARPASPVLKVSRSAISSRVVASPTATEASSDDASSTIGTDCGEESMRMAGALLIGRSPSVASAASGASGDVKEKRSYVCSVKGCGKSYKNANGLKYHEQHGHFTDTGDPTLNAIINKPYLCAIPECGKRYKNPNGLKYHIEHAHSSLIANILGES
ncbi:hypothetical protein M427DRAFT_61007, partial [Gonapodya prolifera JEL478]